MKRTPKGSDETSPKAQATSASRPVKRARGRPASLSRERIIAVAMELLATCTADELSFALLAKACDVAPMTLYNYFSNRESMLNAVADHAFSLLELPPTQPEQHWQQQLLSWMWCLQQHCQRYPVITKVMGFEGGVSNAWLGAVTPVYRITRDLGFRDRELAQVSSWFLANAMGLIIADSLMPVYRRPAGLAGLEALDADTQEIHWLMRKHTIDISSEEWLEFGFNRLISGLEQMLAEKKDNN
jgi:AcrR family transcriptional regulator